ncbi:MAG: hypothetical protein HOQ03_13915 [Thermoleophilia bacterium]|nr:hypothetical protein [Thermoleophilia bacterium]
MKRFVLLTAAVGMLVATGAAVAHLKSADVAAASATVTATTPSNVQTRTYTCDNQTFEVTTGRWSGTATSTTPELNGAAVLHLKSVYNTTKKLGWVDGSLKISSSSSRARLGLSAVNTDGKLDGWVRGHAGRGIVFGSLTAGFTKTGGLTDGALGSGTGTNAAVIAKGIRCNAREMPRPSVHLFVRGQIEAVSATSITVKPKDGSASQTCAVKDGDDVDRVKTGDQVEMTCSQVAGAWVLAKVRRR